MFYQIEKINDIYDEIQELATFSHNELELEKLFGKVVIQKDIYEELEEKKALLVVSARIGKDKELVGYAVYFLSYSIFNLKKQAESHSFFLKKEYRKGFNAMNMLNFAENALKERKVDIVLQKLNVKRDISKIFERMKYKEIEKIFAKEL